MGKNKTAMGYTFLILISVFAALAFAFIVWIVLSAPPAPYNQFTIRNGSERDIVLKSVEVDEAVVEYNDTVLGAFVDDKRTNRSQDIFFLRKTIRDGRLVVKFRFADENIERVFTGKLDAGPRYECRFVISIEADRLVPSPCMEPVLGQSD